MISSKEATATVEHSLLALLASVVSSAQHWLDLLQGVYGESFAPGEAERIRQRWLAADWGFEIQWVGEQ
ncbi:MAG: hypothetical protein RLZZ611_850, partial [Cyanobacteriota bacterium]